MRTPPLIRTLCMAPATYIEKCTKLPLKWDTSPFNLSYVYLLKLHSNGVHRGSTNLQTTNCNVMYCSVVAVRYNNFTSEKAGMEKVRLLLLFFVPQTSNWIRYFIAALRNMMSTHTVAKLKTVGKPTAQTQKHLWRAHIRIHITSRSWRRSWVQSPVATLGFFLFQLAY